MASEINDGFQKGVDDAKLDKITEDAGKESGEAYAKGFGDSTGKEMPDAVGGAFDAATDDIDFKGRGEEGGTQYATGIREGVEAEGRRRNPFESLGARFNDALSDLSVPEDAIDIDADVSARGREGGEEFAEEFGRGVRTETRRRNPFASVGRAFDSMLKSLTIPGGKFAWATTLGTPAIGGAAKLIASLLGGIVAILGNVATAAAGAGVAFVGLAATAVPALLAITQAFKVQTPLLEEFQESMEGIGERWEEFGAAAQEGLLPALERTVELLTDKLLPILVPFARDIGNIAAGVVEWAGAALTSERNMQNWSRVLDASRQIFGTFGEIAIRVADVLPTIFAAAAPIAEEFAETIRLIAERFQNFITTRGTEGLTAIFDEWWERARRLGRILGNVLTTLMNIFNVGADAADPFMQNIEDVTRNWREFTESRRGRNAIKQFFDNAMPVLREFVGLMGDLLDIIISPIFEGDTGGVLEFLRWIRQEIVPSLQEFADSIEGLGLSKETIQNFVQAFLELTQTSLESGAFTGFIETLTTIIELISELVAMPTIGPAVGEFLRFIGVITAISLISPIKLGTILTGLLSFLSGLTGLGGATGVMASLGAALGAIAVPLLAVAAAVAAVAAVWIFWDDIIAGLQAAWEWFTRLSVPLKIIVGLLLAPLAPIALMVGAFLGLIAVFKNWDAVVGAFISAWEAVVDFFQGLPDMLGDFAEAIPGALATAGQAILDFFTNLPSLITQGLSALGGLAVQIGAAFGNLLLDALQAMPGFAAQFGSFLLEQIVNGLQSLASLAVQVGGALVDLFVQGAGLLAEWAIRLPAQIAVWIGQGLFALAELGVEIIGRLVGFLASALPELLEWWLTLPIKIADAIVDGLAKLVPVAGRIIAALVRGLVRALPAIGRFFQRLPGLIIDFIGDAASLMLGVGIALIEGLINGIIAAAPAIGRFFQSLPGLILSFLTNAATFLLSVGRSVITGLLNGIQGAFTTVVSFLLTIPSRIIGLFASAGSFLLQAGRNLISGLIEGARSFLGALNDLFAGIPAAIVGALGDIAGVVGRAFQAAWDFVTTAIPAFISEVVAFFTGLPGQIFAALAELAGLVVSRVTEMAGQAKTAVQTFISEVVTFLTELPGKAFTALANLASEVLSRVGEMADQAKEAVTGFIGEVVDFFLGLPIQVALALINLPSTVLGVFNSMFTTVYNAVAGFLTDIFNFFAGLPQLIINAIGDLAGAVADFIFGALKAGVNIAIDAINFLIPPPVHIPGTDIDIGIPQIPHIAMGDIFSRATLAIIGEAGAEAVIPLTRPQRALELMRASGLDTLAIQNAPIAQETTLIRIDNAVFATPVDLDMLLAKVPHAFNVMVGRVAGR